MRNLRSLVLGLQFLCTTTLGLTLALNVEAQNSSSGSVLGSVTDHTGAAVAKAAVVQLVVMVGITPASEPWIPFAVAMTVAPACAANCTA